MLGARTMVTAVWSTKGGVGVTAISAMLALGQSEQARSTVLVDLCGDLPALLGVPEPNTPGIADWLATPSRSLDALARIETDAAPDLSVLPRGTGSLGREAEPLVDALSRSERSVIVDCGQLRNPVCRAIAESADQRLLVVRLCYLTLRSAERSAVDPTGVVLVKERGRALGLGDVETVVGVPVVAEVAIDPAIARSIDAGLTSTRLPRALLRSIGRVLPHSPDGAL